MLSEFKINQVIESARTTQGLPIGESEMDWLKEIAGELRRLRQQIKSCDSTLKVMAQADPSMAPLVDVVGATTLCVIWSLVGNPSDYDSSGAFLKALGLNLKELSSGQRRGQLAITKRGPSCVRRYLYFWAMRASQYPELKKWYLDFQKVGRNGRGGSEHRKMKGLIALMRKLCRSLWYVHQHQETFDYRKVFPGRPLEKRRRLKA